MGELDPRRLSRTLLLLALVLLVVSPASGQCVIGVYADPAGTISTVELGLYEPFSIYVVIRAEAAINGASYNLVTPAYTQSQGVGSGLYGPDGDGLSIVSPGGENVGFSSCAFGFGGAGILVAQYQSVLTDLPAYGGEYRVEANVDEGVYPVFATCNGLLLECPNTSPLLVSWVFPLEKSSFGAVKALY